MLYVFPVWAALHVIDYYQKSIIYTFTEMHAEEGVWMHEIKKIYRKRKRG